MARISAGWHVVEQGEFLAQIARDAGFENPGAIWNAPENVDLRRRRKDANVLAPGDRVFIPERNQKSVKAATGQRHVFVIAQSKLRLRLRVLDTSGAPIASELCAVTVGDQQLLSTDADGKVERSIALEAGAPTPLDGGLTLLGPRLTFHLKIGDLNPEDDVQGQQARLANLGYFAGFDPPTTPAELAQLRWAVEEFQCDYKDDHTLADLALKVDGHIDSASPNGARTQEALRRIHGC